MKWTLWQTLGEVWMARIRVEVFRLIEITRESLRVEVVRFPKLDFDSWLETRVKSLNGRP